VGPGNNDSGDCHENISVFSGRLIMITGSFDIPGPRSDNMLLESGLIILQWYSGSIADKDVFNEKRGLDYSFFFR